MADAHGSGPCVRKDVEVQLLSRALRGQVLRGLALCFAHLGFRLLASPAGCGTKRPETGFIPHRFPVERVGISTWTPRRRIASGQLTAFIAGRSIIRLCPEGADGLLAKSGSGLVAESPR